MERANERERERGRLVEGARERERGRLITGARKGKTEVMGKRKSEGG